LFDTLNNKLLRVGVSVAIEPLKRSGNSRFRRKQREQEIANRQLRIANCFAERVFILILPPCQSIGNAQLAIGDGNLGIKTPASAQTENCRKRREIWAKAGVHA
jgi:hypothetical protein